METADGARFRSAIAPHEAALLRSLATSVVGILEERESSAPADELEAITGMRTGNSTPPEDDTMKRLLPDFYRPQTEHPAGSSATESLNSALRGLHEPDIIDAKREAAQTLLDTMPAQGGKFELSEDDAHAWAAAVNDMRLALGTMLAISPDGPDELPPDHPMAGHLDVYQWLTVLQEYLVLGLMGKSR
ncbi:transcriptional regulator [Mycolicibacterium novocastrense]|uniref:Transcriptional regulator n=1 Tax=Mycolicibacterium novocastrense TaxID=59813 RepID=A0ABQ0KBS7_MYCNV|nr:transcriptional regulator [Mycolicibacterium novocastrense]